MKLNYTKEEWNRIIFGTDTPEGRKFDIILLWLILISVLIVMLESIESLRNDFFTFFLLAELVFTALFTIEYIIRIWSSKDKLGYILSIWGAIDLLSILPTYLSFIDTGYHYLLVVRIFRLLRIFRILKMVRFTRESRLLITALRFSSYRIGVFLGTVVAIASFLGTMMYVIEGDAQGFSSIPESIYWAIVTITTVGYGNLVPVTVLGKILSSIIMLIGYAIIAVPTGIVTVEMSRVAGENLECNRCHTFNRVVANYCYHCGEDLKDEHAESA